jgi:deoxyribodipyrimidine photolyase
MRPPTEVDRSLVWFRRDLRIDGHAALYQAFVSRAVHFRVIACSCSIRQSSMACRRVTDGSNSSIAA